jgi:hypothetical protein
MMNKRTSSRVGGIAATCGVKWRNRQAFSYPTMAELRALAERVDCSSRRLRRGRPGRLEAPQYWEHVKAKLTAAAKAGRGLRHLSRDELDAVLRKLQKTERSQARSSGGGSR